MTLQVSSIASMCIKLMIHEVACTKEQKEGGEVFFPATSVRKAYSEARKQDLQHIVCMWRKGSLTRAALRCKSHWQQLEVQVIGL